MSPPPLSSCVFAIKLSTSRSNYSIVCGNYRLTLDWSVSCFSSTSHLSGSKNGCPVVSACCYSNRCSRPSPCLMTIRSHLVPLWWCVTQCSTSRVQCSPLCFNGCLLLPLCGFRHSFPLFNGKRRSRVPVSTETHEAVITLSLIS